ncbi:sce7726 family protein [Arthrobacter sp. NPDC055585]
MAVMIMLDARLARLAASLFSSATFRQIARGKRPDHAEKVLESLASAGVVSSDAPRHEALEILDTLLRRSYRNEHIYKSAITTKILLGRHNLRTATMINEFAVGASCVDTVIINGEATAYEIKTELDSAAKLHKQLADYYRVFRKVNVVVHESMIDAYADIVDGTNAGLLALTTRHTLATKRVARDSSDNLDVTTMMKSLRKGEYTDILVRHFGGSPSVPSTRHFSACLDMATTIEPTVYQRYFEDVLRLRKPREPELAVGAVCDPLRYVYLQLDLSRSEHERVDQWLRGSVGKCTSPIYAESSSSS